MAKMKKTENTNYWRGCGMPKSLCSVGGSVNWHNNFGILLSLTACAKTEKIMCLLPHNSTRMYVLKIIPYICAPKDMY